MFTFAGAFWFKQVYLQARSQLCTDTAKKNVAVNVLLYDDLCQK